MIPIYFSPSQDSVHSLTKIIDHFPTKYDHYLIMRDLNMEPNNRMSKSFLDSNKLKNLLKTNNCVKGKDSQLTLFSPGVNIHLSIHHHMKRYLVIIII